jgi:hypothetical protein
MTTWNKAWEGWGLTLVETPPHFKVRGLEGTTSGDRDLMRRAMVPGIIRTEAQYDDLCRIVSEWGYCVETPLDFEFGDC